MSKAQKEFEAVFGLPENFFHNLQLEDDWSLVVKLSALFESICSELLAEELGRPETVDAFALVQMGTRRNGKLAFIHKLKVLRDHEILFLETLADLRNKFAHNIANSQVTVASLIEKMKPGRQKQVWKALGLGATYKCNDQEIPVSKLAETEPKQVIWISSAQILKILHLHMIGSKMRRKLIQEKIQEHIEKNGPIRLREGVASLDDVR